MNELLEYGRGEFEAATWFMDEETSQSVNVSEEVAMPAFSRFMELRSVIMQQQSDIKLRFIFIGMALLEIQRDKLYQYVTPKKHIQGYSTFFTFCSEVFGLRKTTAENMVSIAREYCGEDGSLKLPYLNFSYTQLAEMLPMEEKNRMRIPASLSAKKIRNLKEYYKENTPKETIEEDLADYERQKKEEREKKNAKKNAISFIPAKAPTENVQSTEHDFDGEDERDVITPDVKKPSFEAVRDGLYMQLSLLRQSWEGKGKGMYAAWDTFCTHIETALKARFPDYIKPYNEVTIEEPDEPSFEYLRDVIVNDFGRLKELDPSWLHMANFVTQGLEQKDYIYITKRELLDKARHEIARIARENQELRDQLADNKLACGNLKEEVVEKSAKPSKKGKAASGKLSLKNKKEREEWVRNFRSWGVWLSIPDVSKTFYRYNFENGCALVVEESAEYYTYGKTTRHTLLRYAIIDEERPEFDSAQQGGLSGVVDWLTKHSKEI